MRSGLKVTLLEIHYHLVECGEEVDLLLEGVRLGLKLYFVHISRIHILEEGRYHKHMLFSRMGLLSLSIKWFSK